VAAARAPESDESESEGELEDYYPARCRSGWPPSTVVLTLVAGLAVGYIVGREVSLSGGADTPAPAASVASAATTTPTPTPPAPQAQGDGRQARGDCGQQGQQVPAGPAYIELAAYNARKGPKHAKVTLVEFSDFQ